jgi:hypothetical protein
MDMHVSRRSKPWRIWVGLCAALAVAPVMAGNGHHHHRHDRDRVFVYKGVPSTGINDLCGEPIWTFDFPEPLGPTFRTPNFGIYDPRPGAVDAIPLTPENCTPNAVLATTVDPFFANYIGVGPNDVDGRLLNRPLRDIPMPILFAGMRADIPALESIPAATSTVARYRAEPNYPLTVGEWLSARGELTIRCRADGSATAWATFRNLVPNGVYTVWGSWLNTPEGAPGPVIVPIPFGGAPNSLIADYRGSATYLRQFAACPADDPPDGGSQLLFVALVYHSDGVLYGASPGPFQENLNFQSPEGTPYKSFAIPGIIIHDQLLFGLKGVRLKK